MIRFENVSKVYLGSNSPAVNDLSFEVPEGETCILIGPSGCGKTTSLKMVNRLIEPTEGAIYVGSENVLHQDVVQLRRSIGYVIQQIGLFPHMRIRDNIAIVPKLLGWDPNRIEKRVDTLLDLVGLSPDIFRDRYPKELSGGQKQRVGVARALAADPPVMLMDEPFGAIDPITRDRLQNEFLRLQKRLKKTILFVTHDIDEAIKMGTLISIIRKGELVQFDTPSDILDHPVDEFVADFVGADRGLKKLNLVRVGDVMHTNILLAHPGDLAADALERMRDRRYESMLVVNQEGKLLGYITADAAERSPNSKLDAIIREVIAETEQEATMKDAFSEMLSYGVSYMPVLGDADKVVGIVTVNAARRLIENSSDDFFEDAGHGD